MLRVAALVGLLACGAGPFWYTNRAMPRPHLPSSSQPADENGWIDQLYTANPAEAEAATRQVDELGPRAFPLSIRRFRIRVRQPLG